MKKRVLKVISLLMIVVLSSVMFASCGKKGGNEKIIIYSSSEDYRNEHALKMLKEKFPDYNIDIMYYPTGDLASKLKNEGKNTECDIILELETTYLEQLGDAVCVLDGHVDFSKYLDDLVPESHRYVPWTMLSGAIIINRKALEKENLKVPTSYDDLLKSEYKDLISMPNPKSSGTGYIFLLNMVNERGEEKAFEYFDALANNVLQFTASGSGPMQALTSGEAYIALGMTFQAVNEISSGEENIEIMFFDEGAPYTSYSSAVIEGRQDNEKVMEVFDYIVKEVTPKDKELYSPEAIYKDSKIEMENFPSNIKYGDMTGINDIELKENLLDQWNY